MSSLDKILRDKLIPWSENSAGKRFVVARTVLKKRQLPEGVRLEQQKIPGKRVPVKQRGYGNA
jgi:hypothetical protein